MSIKGTLIESIMREALLSNGFLFEEQQYVRTKSGYYIFDFVVYGDYVKLVVECDGPHHFSNEQSHHDAIRDLWCIQNGYQDICRFSSREIITNVSSCIAYIHETIKRYDLAIINDQEQFKRIQAERNRIKERKGSSYLTNGTNRISNLMENVVSSPQVLIDIGVNIPKHELKSWETMKSLPLVEKRVLWNLIHSASTSRTKIHIGNLDNNLISLGFKQLVLNNFHIDSDTCYRITVLPYAPVLFNKLHRYKHKP